MSVKTVGFKAKRTREKTRKELDQERLQELHPATIARRLALAHRIELEIATGVYSDMADVARAHSLTRARLSQIMGLLFLAPDLQEEILTLEFPAGRQPITERTLRRVLKSLDWVEQRIIWRMFSHSSREPQSSTQEGGVCCPP